MREMMVFTQKKMTGQSSTRTQLIPVVAFLWCLFSISSCQRMIHADFSKRKYLDLKNHATTDKNNQHEQSMTNPALLNEPVSKTEIEPEITEPDKIHNASQASESPGINPAFSEILGEALNKNYTFYVRQGDRLYLLDSVQFDYVELQGVLKPCDSLPDGVDFVEVKITDEWPLDSESQAVTKIHLREVIEIRSHPFIIPPDEPEVLEKPGEADGDETIMRNREFEELPEAEQEQALADFNWMFNMGLAAFVAACIFGLLGFFVAEMFVVAAVLLVILFTMSMVARYKVRHIDESKQSAAFRTKLTLAWVISVIGGIVCVVTIVGGIVLLILRLKDII